jgi:hypothetical protein
MGREKPSVEAGRLMTAFRLVPPVEDRRMPAEGLYSVGQRSSVNDPTTRRSTAAPALGSAHKIDLPALTRIRSSLLDHQHH